MDQNDLTRSIARLGVAIAAADRRVTPEELVALGRLDALGLGSLADAVREELQRAAHEPVDVEATCASLLPLNERAAALLLSVLADIAGSDRRIAPAERAVFLDVAARLGVDAGAAARLLDGLALDAEIAGAPGDRAVATRARVASASRGAERAFALLGLDPGASRADVEAAYLELVHRYDPTRIAELGAEFAALAVRRLATITDAYEAALATMSRPR